MAAVLDGFVDVFENGQIGAVSFYVVYLVLFMMLMEAFGRLSSTLTVRLNWLGEFMKTLAPAYFLAVSTANGVSTAAVFYEGVLLLVWMIQWVLVKFPSARGKSVHSSENGQLFIKRRNAQQNVRASGSGDQLGIKNFDRTGSGAAGGEKSGGACDGFPEADRSRKNSRCHSGDRKCSKRHHTADPYQCGSGKKQLRRGNPGADRGRQDCSL